MSELGERILSIKAERPELDSVQIGIIVGCSCSNVRYWLNPDKYKAGSRKHKNKHKKKRKEQAKKFVYNLKVESGCSKCGLKSENPFVFDFHYLGDKKISIAKMCSWGSRVALIKAEIEKCVILCANCNRKEVSTDGNPYNNNKGKLLHKIKSASSCSDCGEDYYACLDFHHIDPANKNLHIGAAVRDKNVSLADFILELCKCETVCAICHRIKHHREISSSF